MLYYAKHPSIKVIDTNNKIMVAAAANNDMPLERSMIDVNGFSDDILQQLKHTVNKATIFSTYTNTYIVTERLLKIACVKEYKNFFFHPRYNAK